MQQLHNHRLYQRTIITIICVAVLVGSSVAILTVVPPITAQAQAPAPTPKPGFPLPLLGNIVRSSSVALGDLNGDGIADIVVGSTDGRVHAYTGTGQPIWSVQPSTTPIESKAAIGDLDGNGTNEVVVTAGSTFAPTLPGALFIFEHTGALRCKFTPFSFNNNNIPSGIYSSPALVDLDGNGQLEIVFGGYDAHVHFLNNDCTPRLSFFVRDTVWSSPAIADLDGDGSPEITIGIDTHLEPAFGTTNGGRILVYRADGTMMPGFPVQIDEVIYSSPAIGDIDGDGDLEIVVGTGTCWSNPACVPPGYELNPNAGRKLNAWHHTGQPVAGWPIPVTANAFASPALGQLDNDPALEVVVNLEDGWVHALKGNGTPVPGWPVKPFTPAAPDGVSTVSFPTPASPLIADLTGDGRNEVVLPSNFEIVVWDRNGQQLTRTTFPPPPEKWVLETFFTLNSAPAIGDVDGDGFLDLIAASGMNGSTGGLFAWSLAAPATTKQDWPEFRRNRLNEARLLTPRVTTSTRQIRALVEPGRQQSTSLSLTDAAGGSLTWQAQSDQAWLQLTPTNGTTPATLQITFQAAELDAGAYQGTIRITSDGPPLTINVQMQVGSLNRIYLPLIVR